MSKKNDMRREAIQLWRIANYYFCEARSLMNNLQPEFLQQKISSIAENQMNIKIEAEPTKEMIFSAHLGSCAIRLSTIEELLFRCGKESERKKTYDALRKLSDVSQDTIEGNIRNLNIFHLFFRNIIAHREPQGEGRKKVYQEMERFFKARTHDEVYNYIQKSLEETKTDIEKSF